MLEAMKEADKHTRERLRVVQVAVVSGWRVAKQMSAVQQGYHNDPKYQKALELASKLEYPYHPMTRGRGRGRGYPRGGYGQSHYQGFQGGYPQPYPLAYGYQQPQASAFPVYQPQPQAQAQALAPAANPRPVICYNCGTPGHISKYCNQPRANYPSAAAGAPPPPPQNK